MASGYHNKSGLPYKQGFQKGHPPYLTKEGVEKMRIAKLGHSVSTITRKKISEAKKGHSVSIKTRKKISEYQQKNPKRGEISPNWKGGISFEPYTIDWTETLKRSIRERDHYFCQLCNLYGACVHHIDYDKKNCNPSNLVNLCRSCNSKVNKDRDYWTHYFQGQI